MGQWIPLPRHILPRSGSGYRIHIRICDPDRNQKN